MNRFIKLISALALGVAASSLPAQTIEANTINYGNGALVRVQTGPGAPSPLSCTGLYQWVQTDATAGSNTWLCINGMMVQQKSTSVAGDPAGAAAAAQAAAAIDASTKAAAAQAAAIAASDPAGAASAAQAAAIAFAAAGGSNGVLSTQTGSYVLGTNASDNGGTIQMNCTVYGQPCVVTLGTGLPSTFRSKLVSVGSVQATFALSGATFNKGTTPPSFGSNQFTTYVAFDGVSNWAGDLSAAASLTSVSQQNFAGYVTTKNTNYVDDVAEYQATNPSGCYVAYPYLSNITAYAITAPNTVVFTVSPATYPIFAGQAMTIVLPGTPVNGLSNLVVTSATNTSITATIPSAQTVVGTTAATGTAGVYEQYGSAVDCLFAQVAAQVVATNTSHVIHLGVYPFPFTRPLLFPTVSGNASISLEGHSDGRDYKEPSTILQIKAGSTPFPSRAEYIMIDSNGTGYTSPTPVSITTSLPCDQQPAAANAQLSGSGVSKILLTNHGFRCPAGTTYSVTIAGVGTGAAAHVVWDQPALLLPNTVGSLPNTHHVHGISVDLNSFSTNYATSCWDFYDVAYSNYSDMGCRNQGSGGDHEWTFGDPNEYNQSVSQENTFNNISAFATQAENSDAKFLLQLSNGSVSSASIVLPGSYNLNSSITGYTRGIGIGIGGATNPCTGSAPTYSFTQSGNSIIGAAVVNGGTLCTAPVESTTVVSGGANYTAATVLSYAGFGCIRLPQGTPVISNGVITRVTQTDNGLGCSSSVVPTAVDSGGGTGAVFSTVMGIYLQAHQTPTTNYGGRLLVSDSTAKDIRASGNFNIASLTLEAGSNSAIHWHPQTVGGVQYGGVADYGLNQFFDLECDKLDPYCVTALGPVSSYVATNIYYGSNPTDGSGFINMTSTAYGWKFDIINCNNNIANNGTSGWHEFYTATGAIDTGQGTWPTFGNNFTDVEGNGTCDISQVVPYNYMGNALGQTLRIEPFSTGPRLYAANAGSIGLVNGPLGSIDYRNAAGNSNIPTLYMDTLNNLHTYDGGATQMYNSILTGTAFFGVSNAALDTAFCRAQAAVLEVGNSGTSCNSLGSVKAAHFIGGSGSLSIVPGAAAGSSPGFTVTGNDTDFTVTITPGATPSPSQTLFTISFSTTLTTTTPRVTCQSNNVATSAVVNDIANGVKNATTYSMVVGATALATSTPYSWDCQVLQ